MTGEVARPQAPPPAGSGAAGPARAESSAVRVEIVRLPEGLAGRLSAAERPVSLSGTAGSPRPDGTVPIRTQAGEVVIRTGAEVPPGRVVTLQIPPQGGNVAALLAGRTPIPSMLILPQAGASPAPGGAVPPSPPAGPVAGSQGTHAPPGAPLMGSTARPATGGTGSTAATAASSSAAIAASGRSPPGGPASVPGSSASQTQVPRAGIGSAAFNAPTPTGSTAGASGTAPASGPETARGGMSGIPGQAGGVAVEAGGRAGGAPSALPAARTALVLSAQDIAATGAGQTRATGGPASAVSGPPASSNAALPSTAGGSGGGAAASGGGLSAPTAAPSRVLPPGLAALMAASESGQRPSMPVLHDALSALIQADPAAARQFAQTALPQPGGPLAGAITLFLSVVRGGDIRGWMGERAAQTLEASGRGELIGRLGAEMAQASRPATDALGSEWRQWMLPMLADGQLQSLRLAVPHPRPDDEDGPDGRRARPGGKRFLIDLELSRLGPLQLDGRVDPPVFEMTCRARRPLPADIRTELAPLFRDACAATGFEGAMIFESGERGWVDLATDRARTVRV